MKTKFMIISPQWYKEHVLGLSKSEIADQERKKKELMVKLKREAEVEAERKRQEHYDKVQSETAPKIEIQTEYGTADLYPKRYYFKLDNVADGCVAAQELIKYIVEVEKRPFLYSDIDKLEEISSFCAAEQISSSYD